MVCFSSSVNSAESVLRSLSYFAWCFRQLSQEFDSWVSSENDIRFSGRKWLDIWDLLSEHPCYLVLQELEEAEAHCQVSQICLKFKLHAKLGKLQNYVVLEQRYFDVNLFPANDDHPSHDVAIGQGFVKEVYETLRASPLWKEMAFLITYDEHGGFYDHVPTPVSGVPDPDGIIGPDPYYFRFDRLGVRVKTFLVSPWIDKGTGKC